MLKQYINILLCAKYSKLLISQNNRKNTNYNLYYVKLNEFLHTPTVLYNSINNFSIKFTNTKSSSWLKLWVSGRSMLFSPFTRYKDFSFFTYLTVFTFYEQILKQNVWYVNRPVINTLPSNCTEVVYKVYFKMLLFLKKFVRHFRWYHFIYLLTVSFVYKDLTLLKNYIKLKVKHIHFKKHKKLFSIFNALFTLLTYFLIKLDLMRGFNFTVGGKIGMGGDAKKQTLKLIYGSSGISNKSVKLKRMFTSVWTQTGALGIKATLLY